MKPTKELKIGVVRRAWAGKTSLISALFRMADLEDRILIDSIDIKIIRSSRTSVEIFCYPTRSSPFFRVFFRILLVNSVDSDVSLWKVLEDVKLENVISEGLDFIIAENGSNLFRR